MEVVNKQKIEEMAEAHAARVFPPNPQQNKYTERGIAAASYIVGYCDAALRVSPKLFRVHGWGMIPWQLAERAYLIYVRNYGGSGQSLERVNERGGFYEREMDLFLPEWREEVSLQHALNKLHREVSLALSVCEMSESARMHLAEALGASRTFVKDELKTSSP